MIGEFGVGLEVAGHGHAIGEPVCGDVAADVVVCGRGAGEQQARRRRMRAASRANAASICGIRFSGVRPPKQPNTHRIVRDAVPRANPPPRRRAARVSGDEFARDQA